MEHFRQNTTLVVRARILPILSLFFSHSPMFARYLTSLCCFQGIFDFRLFFDLLDYILVWR